jgi:hypothetical protein
MTHMERADARRLRRETSAILGGVSAGKTVKITEGLAGLERQGVLRRTEGDLLEIATLKLEPGAVPPSRLVSEGRAD